MGEFMLNRKETIKCLILFSNFPRNPSDTSGWIPDFVDHLGKQGVNLYVLAPHSVGCKSQETRNTIHISRFKYFHPLRLQKLAYGGGIPENVNSSLLAKIQIPIFIVVEFINAITIIKREKINVINSHWLIPQGFVGALCKILMKRPHIATLHSSEITMLCKMPLGKHLARFIVKNSDTILSVSQHRAHTLISLLPKSQREDIEKKLQIIPMGIDKGLLSVNRAKQDLKDNLSISFKYVILFVGRLVEVKGCQYLIESLKMVTAHRSDALLLIVGSGPLESKLKRIVSECGLSKYVRFEGFVDHNKIGIYYTLADVVVIPSIVDSSGYEEGLPVTLLEAMAAGKAVVGTNTRGLCEVIRNGENGLLVDQKCPEQLAEKILDLLNNDMLRANLSKNALSCSKDYDWDLIGEKYANIMFRLTTPEYIQRGGG